MLDKVLTTVAAVVIPLLGLILRASRRNRLRHRIDDYLVLADKVEEHDAESAGKLRVLASESVQLLVTADQKWLRRRFDPGAFVALLFLTVPTAVVFGLAWTWHGWWKWPLIGFTLIWTLVWGGVGVTQLWKQLEMESEDSAAE